MRPRTTFLLLLLPAAVLAGCEPKPPTPKAALASTASATTANPGSWTSLGLQVREAPESARRALGIEHGVMVMRVRPPASRTRILPGDVIVEVNLARFRGLEEFNRLVQAQRGAVALLVRRTDADLYITMDPAGEALRGETGDASRGSGAPGAPVRRPATGKPLRT
ncbi:MAG TPA: PDZ domain-containing protein [Ramlibacter sp.]|nr:PDZ domain-containing protein [Ramlibacter sp.]